MFFGSLHGEHMAPRVRPSLIVNSPAYVEELKGLLTLVPDQVLDGHVATSHSPSLAKNKSPSRVNSASQA